MTLISEFISNIRKFKHPQILLILFVTLVFYGWSIKSLLCENKSIWWCLYFYRVISIYATGLGIIIRYYNARCSNVNVHRRIMIYYEPLIAGANGGANGGEENNDTQNVHDTSVQKHIVNVVSKLQKNTKIIFNNTRVVEQLRDYISGYTGSSETREAALHALSQMVRQRAIIVNLNMNEIDVLCLVWNRILDPVNSAISKTIKDNLVLELADIVTENRGVYCVQGRVTRMIQALECADAENIVNIRPLWVIREEIARFCSSYRTRFIMQLSKKAQYLCNECLCPTDRQKQFIRSVNQRIHDGVKKRLGLRYQEIITAAQLESIAKPFLDELRDSESE